MPGLAIFKIIILLLSYLNTKENGHKPIIYDSNDDVFKRFSKKNIFYF
jgi:hypothetical protein